MLIASTLRKKPRYLDASEQLGIRDRITDAIAKSIYVDSRDINSAVRIDCCPAIFVGNFARDR